MADYSGTYAYAPRLIDIALEAFDRCGIRAAELTPDHWISMRRTMNLVFASWSNRGVNLWLVDTQTVNLSQGVSEYAVPTDTVNVEEAFIRPWQMGQPASVTPSFATTALSTTVTGYQIGAAYAAGSFVNIQVPVSVGGIVLQGFYEVVSIPTPDSYTFAANEAATATVTGGVVPMFTTGAQSTTVTVTLPDHGLLGGQPFVVQVATYVGGITLSGTYTVETVLDADRFTITALQTAGAADSAYENGGLAYIAGQQTDTPPQQDRIMWPFSRVDYTNLPNKFMQGFPTNYYYDRLINPTITLWPVPDGNGPYQLIYNRVTQPQDCNPQGGQQPYLPYRSLESFHSDVAAHFAMKWQPTIAKDLMAYAQQRWAEFAETDSERVTTHILPMLDGYYRA